MADKRHFVAGLILCASLEAFSQTSASAPTTVLIGTPPQPSWSLLSTPQKIILAPLAKDWDGMEHVRRKKWLGIADRFPKMTPDEQQRVQQRMHEWVALPPEKRARARDGYKEFNQLPAEQKQTVRNKWEAYSNLSEEEKQKLRQSGKQSSSSGETNLAAPAKSE